MRLLFLSGLLLLLPYYGSTNSAAKITKGKQSVVIDIGQFKLPEGASKAYCQVRYKPVDADNWKMTHCELGEKKPLQLLPDKYEFQVQYEAKDGTKVFTDSEIIRAGQAQEDDSRNQEKSTDESAESSESDASNADEIIQRDSVNEQRSAPIATAGHSASGSISIAFSYSMLILPLIAMKRQFL